MKIYTITFSPTGTTSRIVNGISSGICKVTGESPINIDVTHNDLSDIDILPEDLVVVAVPVYGGKAAPIAKRRIEKIRGDNARCIVVAVYGNRAFENALTDMSSFMADHDFIVCGAAAFIGEHSYSTRQNPIASQRPDEKDISAAVAFGREIGERLVAGTLQPTDVSLLKDEPSPEESLANFRRFVMDYQQRQSESPVAYLPELDKESCSVCGRCYEACPTGAITPHTEGVDASRCIKCCACVKVCSSNARILNTPFAKPLSENFNMRKSPRWLLE